MVDFYRGETTVVVVSFDDIDVADISVAFLSFVQGGTVLFEKELSDLGVNEDTNSFIYQLTQEESLMFYGGDAYFKFVGKTTDGQRVETPKEMFAVGTTVKNVVI